MKAVIIDKFGTADDLYISDVPLPEPDSGEVRIKIHYAGVNPVDWKLCAGILKDKLTHEFPFIPGWDAAGTIDAVGEDVTSFKVGDPIYAYCRKPIVHSGTYAEYICFRAEDVAPKPQTLTFAEAAAIPLVALTAWQGLFDKAHLKTGDKVLIHAGAGGVGGMAIQFAKYVGAEVITTASKKNHRYVTELGADWVIDYREEDFASKVHEIFPSGVDIVFDCVGGETQVKSFECMRKGGSLICIVNAPDKKLLADYQVIPQYLFVEPNGEELRQIGDLIDEGIVRPPIIQEMNISEVKEAHSLQKEGHVAGKLVLEIAF